MFLLLNLNRFYVYITLNRFRICSWAIYKTTNTGTENRMREMRAKRGMFTRIPGNFLEDSGECHYFNILGNVPEDSGECWRRFRGMFKRIPQNVPEHSGEISRGFPGMFERFWGMFEEILGNAHEDSGECLKADSRVAWPDNLFSGKLYAILLNH